MAKVKVTHKKLTSEEAKEAPKREPVPVGQYHAMICNVTEGTTRHSTPLSKVSVEFQIIHQVTEDGGQDDSHQGRRVYQDFILEHEEAMPDLSEQRRWELVMLLDACNAEYDDEGFDPDDLKEKTVLITVRHREGDKVDEVTGQKRVFTNVVKVDSTEPVEEGDLI